MYITVTYGDSENEIFNPDCKTYLLLKTIKRKCKCNRDEDIDLSDEAGNIKNLRDPLVQHRYAAELLDYRERLVLLKVEKRSPESNHVTYSPLLQEEDSVLTDEFLARLAIKDPESRPESRRVKSNTRRTKDKGQGHEKTNDKSKQAKNDKRSSASRSKR